MTGDLGFPITEPGTVGPLGLLAPGVRGYACLSHGAVYIPIIEAVTEGSGDVGRFLDRLPTDRRVVFPTVLSARLRGMLVRRGFTDGEETVQDRADPYFGETVRFLSRL